MGKSGFLFAVLVVATLPLGARAQSGEAVALVGEWGDPARIRIEGLQHFDSQQIQRGLTCSFEHFMAGHPSAPLSEFPQALERHLLRGYQHAGFDEASVTVRLDTEAELVCVQVTEGPRWMAGAIRVTGPPSIREKLAEMLVKPHVRPDAAATRLSDAGGVLEWADADGKKIDEDKPVWIVGKPATFDRPSAEARQQRVQQCLADLGFDQAVFSSELRIVNGTAEWWVGVEHPGTPAILKTIVIRGNRINSEEEFRSYLKLQPGSIVTRELRRRIETSLWNSARFRSSAVVVERLPDQSGVCLAIDVEEYASAPSLSTPLSREEAALLKHRSWMVDGPGSKLDLVITVTGERGQLESIISPDKGISVCGWNEPDTNRPPDFAFAATEDRVSACAVTSGRTLTGALSTQQLNATLSMSLTDDPEHRFKVTFGLGVKSLDDNQQRMPFTLMTSMPPVYFLALAHEGAVCTWDGPILTIDYPPGTLRIHEESGQLIEFKSKALGDDWRKVDYSFQAGAFARRQRQLAEASAGFRNEYDAQRPISSAVAFFLDSGLLAAVGEFLYGEPFANAAPQESLAVLGKLVDRNILVVADSVVTDWIDAPDEKFAIPWQPDVARQFQDEHYIGFAFALLADQMFPRNSWAWTLWRETALVYAGLSMYASSEVERVVRDERSGPTAYWLVAELLHGFNQPVEPLANRGLQKMDRVSFMREWESLLGSDLPPSLVTMLAAMRSLSEEDVSALLKFVGGSQPGWARATRQFRAAISSRPTPQTADLLEIVWSSAFRDLLEPRLKHLATPVRLSDKPDDGVNR